MGPSTVSQGLWAYRYLGARLSFGSPSAQRPLPWGSALLRLSFGSTTVTLGLGSPSALLRLNGHVNTSLGSREFLQVHESLLWRARPQRPCSETRRGLKTRSVMHSNGHVNSSLGSRGFHQVHESLLWLTRPQRPCAETRNGLKTHGVMPSMHRTGA